jgi:hypothetical protein
MQPYTFPAVNVQAFNCPHCNAFAKQFWSPVYVIANGNNAAAKDFLATTCSHCNKPSYWFQDQLIYPNKVTAPLPNIDLPDDIKIDFEEARQISNLSPKGAAALLRLAIQKLCVHLGEPGKDLNKDIGSLVKKGLPVGIQKALDIVRVIGNESVHPGQIDISDDPVITNKLFDLVNLIAETMISKPNEIDKLFDGLPQAKKEAIQKRDGQ